MIRGKQDVCKFKATIDKWDKEGFFIGNKTVPKPLGVDIFCKEKRVDTPPERYADLCDDTTSGTTTIPNYEITWGDPLYKTSEVRLDTIKYTVCN